MLQEFGFVHDSGARHVKEGINFVDLDFDYAIHTCVDYLAELGHTHIAFINHSPRLFEEGVGYVIRGKNVTADAREGK